MTDATRPSPEPGRTARLDAAALREIAEAQDVILTLIGRMRRRFDYADETDFTFRPDHDG